MSHIAAQPLSRGEVGAKVDPGENSAQGRLFCSRREALEGALHSRHNFRGDVKVKLIPFEERTQYACPGSTNNCVRTRIGGSGVVLPTSGSQLGSAVVSGLCLCQQRG